MKKELILFLGIKHYSQSRNITESLTFVHSAISETSLKQRDFAVFT